MSEHLLAVPVEATEDSRDDVPAPVSLAPRSENPVVLPHDPPPLDLRHLVDAAAARLDESWVRPDVSGHMMASGLADEFAATLCAYGMVATEVAHMQDRIDERQALGRPDSAEGDAPLAPR